ncbi:hypothetical protein Taro_024640 [Colocasia esculenta]|uniref:Uncharacterized protein n=1 Tax=Colocasia esculenta TaxID=4460 RepID=A0A843VF32_COLES|nr:hypothetical protein [Colocasia esculenta]
MQTQLRRRLCCKLSCRHRLRLQLQFPRSMAMVVHPSWRGCGDVEAVGSWRMSGWLDCGGRCAMVEAGAVVIVVVLVVAIFLPRRSPCLQLCDGGIWAAGGHSFLMEVLGCIVGDVEEVVAAVDIVVELDGYEVVEVADIDGIVVAAEVVEAVELGFSTWEGC